MALRGAGPNLSKLATHLHHAWPRYLGGLNKNNLVRLTVKAHQALHAKMQVFLKTYGLNYSRVNSGAVIRLKNTKEAIKKALTDFYNGPGAKYKEAAEQFFKYIDDL